LDALTAQKDGRTPGPCSRRAPPLWTRSPGAHQDPRSFPTRRSSDLRIPCAWRRSRMEMADPAVIVSKKKILVVDDEESIRDQDLDRKSTRLNSSHRTISYAVFCLKKKI